ncbi:MAG: ATP-binding protein [Bacteroidales bacterium]|nr:ATP-binding protein [Bacteroidales bacterium]MBR7024258.1 ATP-binding protein [Bacteroidales bacterium]
MLLRITFQNILSFYEKTTFDMFPNPKREIFANHINTNEKIPLLKHALIYGANGSGKSNFVKVLQFLKSFVTIDNFLNIIDLNEFVFQLVRTNKEPMKIEIEFFTKGNYYIYQLEIQRSQKNNIKERLLLSGLGEQDDSLVFERFGDVVSPTTDNKLSTDLLKKNNGSSIICLNTKYPVINEKHIQVVHDWFLNDFDIITINSQTPFLIDMMSSDKQLLDYANTLLSSLHITDSLKVGETPVKKWMSNKKNASELQQMLLKNPISEHTGLTSFSNNRNNFNITMKNGEQIVQEFLFEQLGIGGYKKKMNIASQSDGTVRLLTLIPALYYASKGKVVVIDEVENSMHPNLIYNLLKYFFNSESKGQLICTTHLTLFQDQQDLIRPDELWKVEKENGNSKMHSFNDYKIHNTMNIEKGYLEGRYGGVPQISIIE